MKNNDILIEVRNLGVRFPIKQRSLFRSKTVDLHAVVDVSFNVNRGETVGLVGESGSGKTTVGRAILRAIDPTDGEVIFHSKEGNVQLNKANAKELRNTRKNMGMVLSEGVAASSRQAYSYNLATMAGNALRSFRPHMSMVFQDPYSSLNPRMTVRDLIAEPLIAPGISFDGDIDERVRDIAARCKLNLEHLRRFPHAFSGGQRQRICIARALVSNPEFIVCDESVSALDVSTQADIINLLKDLQEETGVAYIFIAHDLSVVSHMSDKVAVMYVGQFVEYAPTKSIFSNSRHPYTRTLMAAIPQLERELNPKKLIGEIPNPLSAPSGCRFHTRCPYAQPKCSEEAPEWRLVGDEHYVACHYADDINFDD